MENQDWLAGQFEQNRSRLKKVAYRMLGSASEADDAVQETWLRLSRSDTAVIDNLAGWLTTVVARVCLDMLRSRNARHEELLDIDGPSQIADTSAADPEQEAILADSIGPALLVVLGFLAGWLLFHTLGEDQTMARQIHAVEAGVSPDRAYIEANGARLEPEHNALARTMVTLYSQLSGQLYELELHGRHFEKLVHERTAHLNAMTVDLARARDAAEVGSRAKSRFIGTISHELRTPMNAVLGFARLLQGEQLPPRQAGLAGKIVKASEHLLGLVNDVIDRVPLLATRAAYAKQAIRDRLQDHKQYISQFGDDMPEIRDWQWGGNAAARFGQTDTAGDNA